MTNKKGFTLIELLIVIAIIGILSAALLPTVLNAPARGRDAARIGNINSIMAGLEAYNSDNGKYPQTDGCASAIFGTNINLYFSGGSVPKDPSGARDTGGTDCVDTGEYYYQYIGDNEIAEYIIGTVMEMPTNNNTMVDPTIDPTEAIEFPSCTDGSCLYYIEAR